MLKELDSILEGRIVENASPEKLYLEHLARYKFASSYCNGKVVLDIGCATGFGSNYLTKSAKSVVGLEIDEETFAYAANRYRCENLRFVQGDAIDLPFPNEHFDVVVSFLVIEHIKESNKFLEAVQIVLKRGGIAIFATPNRKVYSLFHKRTHCNTKQQSPAKHFKEFDPQELCMFLKDYFADVHLYGQNNLGLVGFIIIFLRTMILALAAKVLSLLPKGTKVAARRLLGYRTSLQSYELSTGIAEKQIGSLEDGLFKRSKHIIAVCENSF
jgi:SAM-dependent methyltransferase